MKNSLTSKKITFAVLLVSIAITISYFVTMINFSDTLSFWTIVGTAKPLGAFGVCSMVLSSFFLFFPQTIFVSFLKRVASWYLPILFFLTATTPAYSGHVMSVDRSVVVLYGMVVLGLIGVVYAFVMKKKVPV